eukprot:TRINITY_DN9840_c0_g1_i2.p1 TRINITY_DN9840_c0_g1~~TRINITY_DN9840_c0_g1_i2.p1  ORF type:complete len:163 (-),score=21.09 TRINITY_DN9840_c0_g1_i2:242-730(-)
MIRRPPRSTHCISSAASDVYKRQVSTQSTWENYKRKAWVTANLIDNGPTMVYCNSPSDCRNTANALFDLVGQQDCNQTVLEVIKFLENNIHPEYFFDKISQEWNRLSLWKDATICQNVDGTSIFQETYQCNLLYQYTHGRYQPAYEKYCCLQAQIRKSNSYY